MQGFAVPASAHLSAYKKWEFSKRHGVNDKTGKVINNTDAYKNITKFNSRKYKIVHSEKKCDNKQIYRVERKVGTDLSEV
jgi:hypothetical protein